MAQKIPTSFKDGPKHGFAKFKPFGANVRIGLQKNPEQYIKFDCMCRYLENASKIYFVL